MLAQVAVPILLSVSTNLTGSVLKSLQVVSLAERGPLTDSPRKATAKNRFTISPSSKSEMLRFSEKQRDGR